MPTFNNNGLKISRKIMASMNFFYPDSGAAHETLILINYKDCLKNIK